MGRFKLWLLEAGLRAAGRCGRPRHHARMNSSWHIVRKRGRSLGAGVVASPAGRHGSWCSWGLRVTRTRLPGLPEPQRMHPRPGLVQDGLLLVHGERQRPRGHRWASHGRLRRSILKQVTRMLQPRMLWHCCSAPVAVCVHLRAEGGPRRGGRVAEALLATRTRAHFWTD